jgi:hypothetical protein
MVIESKYDIGQEIWDIYRDGKEIIIRKDKIVEVIYNEEKGILYMLSICDDIEEKDVITVDDSVALLRKVYDLQKEIDSDEERS